MPRIMASGHLSLTDLNDAIVSGTQPTSPSTGQLWVDESTNPNTIKRYNGSSWDIIGEILDSGTGQIITDVKTTLGNMANDALIDYSERQYVKDKLTQIIGYIISDSATTLPTASTLDAGTSGKGSFYYARKNATVAGIPTSDAKYVALATAWENATTGLKTYLESLTPIDVWDLRTSTQSTNITVVKDTWRAKWQSYYQAELELDNLTAQRLRENADNINVGGTNYASNGNFEIALNSGLWSSSYTGGTSEIVDISTEAPPFKYAYHVKNTTNVNGGIFSPVIWSGVSSEALVDKDITVSFWIKYQNIVQGTNAWNLGRFGEIIVEGLTSTSTKVYRYPRLVSSGVTETLYTSGTNMTWAKWTGTYKLSLPSTAVKLSSIQFKHGLESCAGEFWTTGIKIELGNRVTDWSQSPYDIQQRVSSVEFKVLPDQIYSSLKSVSSYNASMASKEAIKDFSFENGVAEWKQDHALTQALVATVVSGVSAFGANAIEITSQKYVFYGKPIPIDTSHTYKAKFRVRQTVDPTTAGKSKVYAGVACFDVNKQPLTATTFGTHRYCITKGGVDISVAGGWQTFEGTIKGEGDEGYNQFIAGTKYAVPMFIVNYSLGDGKAQVDYCSLEDISEINVVATQVDKVEQSLTATGISTVIESSTFYQGLSNTLNGKADNGDLEGLASAKSVSDLSDSIDGKISSAVSGIDFTPYATKLDLEQTSTNMTAKFSATGGANLLKNSIGFSDLITTADYTSGKRGWILAGSASRLSKANDGNLITLGFSSGFQFLPASDGLATTYIYQDVPVIADNPYTLSWYVNKTNNSTSNGQLFIQFQEQNDVGTWVNIKSYIYENSEVTDGYVSGKLLDFVPTTSLVRVRIYAYGEVNAVVTGLMFTIGDVALQWTLATGESYNTNVRMDINGIRVSQLDINKKEVGYTQISPDEFAGYYDTNGDSIYEKVFYLKEDETVSKKFRAINEFTMGTIKIIKIPSDIEWSENLPLKKDDTVTYSGRVYTVTVAGTTGTTPPTHTSSTATNGTTTLLYKSTSANIGWAFVPV